jgi:quercetin dioxygenase-like cupin family protein
MALTSWLAMGRNAACAAVFLGLSAYWLAHAQPNAADDEARFTGISRTLEAEGWRVSRRSFEPGARTAWHRHPGGQLLFVESGRARLRERGAALLELAVGASHYTAPNVEHWHGATPDSELRQVALARGEAAETVWLEKVSDDEYAGR